MKISLNWLKKYVNIDVSDEELVRLIGARLVEVEGVIDETHKYDNIYVVRVEKAEKIPDTHLTLCQVNVGDVEIPKVEKSEDGLVQVVCGAPNVHEGMLAAWIAPGAIVPASVHEDAPFVIGKRKMLGKYESNGMLAGADELDFDDKHEKIAEIDPAVAQPGDALADVFGLNDKILEIENKSLTHRPDCFGVIGFAREVAGILGQKFVEPEFLHKETVFPEGFLEVVEDGLVSREATLDIEIADAELCPRYTGAVLKVTEATAEEKYLSEMQMLIAKSGMMPVSRIVDVTNYLMLLTGQPLHAFDYDKFLAVGGGDASKVIVRAAKVGETLELIDGKTIECVPSDILVTSSDVPVALAGAMGGKNTEIDENTKNILLEAATFSLYHLRKTQMAHGIFTEAITRFTKGVPIGGTFNVLAEAVKEMNAKPLELRDKVCVPFIANIVEVTVEDINGLLGTEYSKALIVKTLENVGFEVIDKKDSLQITAPAWRTDIHIKEDIIEEVGRLLGYDNIVPTLPLHQTAEPNQMWELEKRIRETMRRLGANELLTYSFVAGRLLEKAGQDSKNSYKIVNSISPELQYVRQSIVPSLLEKAYINQKIPFDKFALYEINKVYQKAWGMNEENVPVEKIQMGMVLAERKGVGTAYYRAKKYAEELLGELQISVKFLPLQGNNAENRPFEPKRSATIVAEDEEIIGVVGEFRKSVRMGYKLAEYTAGMELNLDTILNKLGGKREIYVGEVEKRDLTIKTAGTYAEMIDKIHEVLAQNNADAVITPISIYQPEGATEKNISVHLEFHHKIDDKIMQELEKL
ncbi:phenylalanine--tRNA ligase subunit beta [Candidatus Saccharibacteria bacterium]|nr:phenylalanine--tRNA ligase subunit beta [Candidatus Saccharibacteria bacterium]